MGRPKILCDYTFIRCTRHATVRFIVKKRGHEPVMSQYCEEHVKVMLAQPIPTGWRIAERMKLSG